MELTLIAKDPSSGGNGCPSIYSIDGTASECVVQGYLLDGATEANLRNVLPGEGAVRIKVQVLRDFLARLG